MFNRSSLSKILQSQNEIINNQQIITPSIPIGEDDEELTFRERFSELINKINRKKNKKKNRRKVVRDLVELFEEMFPVKLVDLNDIFDN